MGKRETTDANIAANSNIKEIFIMSSSFKKSPGTNCMLPCVLKVLNSTKAINGMVRIIKPMIIIYMQRYMSKHMECWYLVHK